MSILLLPVGSDGQAYNDSSGAPRSGAQMFIYLAGTSTKATLYQDKGGAANHTNPIVLNTSGQVANGSSVVKPIFVDSGADYDVVLAPSNDTDPPVSPYFTLEDIEPVNDATATATDQWTLGGTPTYVSATSLTLAGDVTSTYHVGRRIKTTNSGGTIYSTITVSAYTTLTTLTVVNDSGTLDAGLSDIYYSILTATGPAIPVLDVSDDSTFHDAASPTKKMQFDASGITAGQTRVITAPDVNVTLPYKPGTYGAMQVYTSSGTWTKPAGLKRVKVTVVSGGGGGGGAAQATGAGGGGGGAGATSIKTIEAASLGATETVTVGAGGAGGTAGDNAGSTGGTSSFGAHASCTGGAGGAGSGTATGSAGGTASGGDINISGGYGENGNPTFSGTAGAGGNGGAGSLGGGARGGVTSNNGEAATCYGSGGGGACDNNSQTRAGGAGKAGIVFVEEFF